MYKHADWFIKKSVYDIMINIIHRDGLDCPSSQWISFDGQTNDRYVYTGVHTFDYTLTLKKLGKLEGKGGNIIGV